MMMAVTIIIAWLKLIFIVYLLQVGSVGLLQALSSLDFSVADLSLADGGSVFVTGVAAAGLDAGLGDAGAGCGLVAC